jgi:transcriptional regulator with XRE-family HTH domain
MKSQSKYLENAKFRIENKKWLKYSKNIAIRIIAALEGKKITNKLLAQKLDISLKDLNQIFKGQEDFSLSLIANISNILNKELISFPDFKYNKPISNTIKNKKTTTKRHKETDYLLSSKKNAKHIREGIKQLNEGKSKKINLKDLWK